MLLQLYRSEFPHKWFCKTSAHSNLKVNYNFSPSVTLKTKLLLVFKKLSWPKVKFKEDHMHLQLTFTAVDVVKLCHNRTIPFNFLYTQKSVKKKKIKNLNYLLIIL